MGIQPFKIGALEKDETAKGDRTKTFKIVGEQRGIPQFEQTREDGSTISYDELQQEYDAVVEEEFRENHTWCAKCEQWYSNDEFDDNDYLCKNCRYGA